jgi:flavin reductase (DIM6/NTAB) family NADH-FMN oxidoreductase RutF
MPFSPKEHVEINPSVLYVGTPVALITSTNPDGSTNISPISSAWALFDRVIIGLTSTSENLVRERQLVINFPSPDLWPRIEAIARATGRNPVPSHKEKIGYRFEPDKFAPCGLTPAPSTPGATTADRRMPAAIQGAGRRLPRPRRGLAGRTRRGFPDHRGEGRTGPCASRYRPARHEPHRHKSLATAALCVPVRAPLSAAPSRQKHEKPGRERHGQHRRHRRNRFTGR